MAYTVPEEARAEWGQVGAIRASQYIVKRYGENPAPGAVPQQTYEGGWKEETAFGERVLRGSEGCMTDVAGQRRLLGIRDDQIWCMYPPQRKGYGQRLRKT